MALVSPLVLLLLSEAMLRLAGYGYDPGFFLTAEQDGAKVCIENPRFGWRFFPSRVARSPQPLSFLSRKPEDTVRIFLFGESAAMGDPEPAYGLARQLERLLQTRHPDKHVEVINVAMTAIGSHVIREIARDCAPMQGDAWLIYAGNNEVVGPFGAGTVFGRQAPSLAAVRLTLALRRTRLGQLLGNIAGRREPAEWTGMELFLGQQVGREDPRLAKVCGNFAANLENLITCGKGSGAKVVLATVAVNLTNCPPFASAHTSGLATNAKEQWQQYFNRGAEQQKQQRFVDALQSYQESARLDSSFAELIFRRAQCESALNQSNAIEDFRLARDLDTLRFRADSRINEIVRQTAQNQQVPLVEAARELANSSGPEDLFYDHVHLNFSGNYQLAQLFLPVVEQQLFGKVASDTPVASEAELKHQLAFTEFDFRRVAEEMQQRLRQPPFSEQSNFEQRDEHWRQVLNTLSGPPSNAIPQYQIALAASGSDWVLHANFGRLLEAAGDRNAAADQWREFCRLMPHEPDGWFQLANLSYDARRYTEAEGLFREALNRRPNSTEALNGLGLALAEQKRGPEAIRQFRRALRVDPRFGAARVNLALGLAGGGDTTAAEAEYRTAIRLDTNSVGARINLAKLLGGQGKKDEAIQLYQEAAALKPADAVAQFNLGNALVAQDRHAEALAHFASAVTNQPEFADARYNFAVELARQNQIPEALDQFGEVVRLKPGWAEAHFNYGIALARQRRYAEAVEQFREALKLQPNDVRARTALEQALRRSGGGPH